MATTEAKPEVSTRDRLVAAVIELSRDRPTDEVKVEEVLSHTGISTGSLYHHFEDFGHLQETAMVERYNELLKAGLVMVEAALDEATSFEDVQQRVAAAGVAYGKLNTPQSRFERARILAKAEHHERLREELSAAQQEVTDALTEMLARAQQEGGWVNPEVDPRALAVFVQAYTFGRLVDDLASEPMKQDDWQFLTTTVFSQALLRNPGA